MKILNTTDRKQLAQLLDAKTSDLRLRSLKAAAPLSVDEKTRSIEFVMSDETQDHCGDVIRQGGWDLSVFSKNPVLAWAHDYDDPPIGGWDNVRVATLPIGPALVGRATFAAAEDYPFADTIFRLAARGFLRAVSVGFNPMEYGLLADKSGYEFQKQTLLECSACTVPCNPNALARSVADGVISRRELVDLAVRRALAEINAPADMRPVLAHEAKDLSLQHLSDLATSLVDAAGSTPALAAASPELARCLELLAEIRAEFSAR